MPGVTFDISNSILDWISRHRSFSNLKTEMVHNIQNWKLGTKKPTFKQIESLSKATNIPFGYFFLQKPPKEDISFLKFRTIDSEDCEEPSRELIDTMFDMQIIQEWLKDYHVDNGYDRNLYVGSLKHTTMVSLCADKVLQDLGLKKEWYVGQKDTNDMFKKWRSCLEQLNITVMMNGVVRTNNNRKLDLKEFRAFTLVDEYAPLIFINACDSEAGRLFSIVHETIHVWKGENSLFNDTWNNFKYQKAEAFCNSVAAEILVPSKHFLEKWSIYEELEVDERLKQLRHYFKCSEVVLARRALDNRFIDSCKYEEIVGKSIACYENIKAKKSSGGNYYATMGTRVDKKFLLKLLESVQNGATAYTEAYRMTNTKGKTFSRLVKEITGVEL